MFRITIVTTEIMEKYKNVEILRIVIKVRRKEM